MSRTQIGAIARRSGVQLPDSAMVEGAIERAQSESSPMLFNHVMRSALFAEMFAGMRPQAKDREVIAVSSILHDIGLTDQKHQCEERFEVRSAHAARAFALGQGVSDARAWLIWDTVALHTHDLNLYKQDEAWAVQMGILADVVGAGADLLDVSAMERILTLFPRLGFKKGFYDLLSAEARSAPPPPFHPTTMILHHDCGSLSIPNARDLIAHAPFDD